MNPGSSSHLWQFAQIFLRWQNASSLRQPAAGSLRCDRASPGKVRTPFPDLPPQPHARPLQSPECGGRLGPQPVSRKWAPVLWSLQTREATPPNQLENSRFCQGKLLEREKKQPQKLPSKTFFHSPKKGNFDVRKGKGQNLRIKFLKPSKSSFMKNPPAPCYFYFSPLELKITLETPQHPPPSPGQGRG